MAARELKITFDGASRIARPHGVQALNMFAHVEGITGSFVVMEFMAHDPQEFWDCWRSLGGDEQNITYEDGSKFIAPYAPTIPIRAKSWLDRLWEWLFPWTDDDG